MEAIRLGAVLLLPWLVAGLWVKRLWGEFERADWALVVGYSYPIGMIFVTILMRISEGVGMALSFETISLMLVASALPLILWRSSGERIRKKTIAPDLSSLQKIAIVFFVFLIFGRLSTLALELVYRPVYPWDAWLVWAPRAKIWSELEAIVPVVSPATWWIAQDPDAYNTLAANQPAAVSLIQAWIAMGLDTWNESLIALPWLFCGIAMLLGFYGQARRYFVPPLVGIIFTYLLISMPIVGTHVALGGYADLWMATVFLMAVMALADSILRSDRRQAVLAAVFLPLPLLLKKSGFALVLAVIPALLLKHFSLRLLVFLVAVLIFLLLLTLKFGGWSVVIPGLGLLAVGLDGIAIPGLVPITLRTSPFPAETIRNHYWVYDNWHLLWFLFPAALVIGLWRGIFRQSLPRCLLVIVVSTIATFGFIFSFTGLIDINYLAATINRISLFFAPVFLFSIMVWFWAIPGRGP